MHTVLYVLLNLGTCHKACKLGGVDFAVNKSLCPSQLQGRIECHKENVE